MRDYFMSQEPLLHARKEQSCLWMNLPHVAGKIAAKMIYTIAGGIGKKRMTSDAVIRKSYTWATFAVLSGECSLEEKVKSDGGDWMAGMAVRLVDIDVTGVNRSVEKSVFQKIEMIERNYGHAGPMFVRSLVDAGLHRRASQLRDRVDQVAGKIAGANADGPTLRAALPFALLNVAGQLAKRTNVLPDAVDVDAAVSWAWKRFMGSSNARVLSPEEDAVAGLNSWIAGNWDVTVKSTSEEAHGSREALGWYDEDAVYIRREHLRTAAGGVLKEANIAAILDRGGLLFKKSDASHRYVKFVKRIGAVQAYALSRSKFGRRSGDEPEIPVWEFRPEPRGPE
jgi:putative DNA primase/helicase